MQKGIEKWNRQKRSIIEILKLIIKHLNPYIPLLLDSLQRKTEKRKRHRLRYTNKCENSG